MDAQVKRPKGGSVKGQPKIGWVKTNVSTLMLVVIALLWKPDKQKVAAPFCYLFPEAYRNLTVTQNGITRNAVAADIRDNCIDDRGKTLNRRGEHGTKDYKEHPLDRPNKRPFVGEAQRIIRDNMPISPEEAVKRADACIVAKPAKRRYDVPKPVKALHLRVVHTRLADWCPCCREEIITRDGVTPINAHCDHFEDAYKNKAEQTWYVCIGCHDEMTHGARTDAQRAAFSAYQREVAIYKRAVEKV